MDAWSPYPLLNLLAGALIGFYSSSRISDRNAQNSARQRFYVEIAPVAVLVRKALNGNKSGVGETLEGQLEKVASAIEAFRPYVAHTNSAPFEEAWSELEVLLQLNDFVPKNEPYREIRRVLDKLVKLSK